MNSSNYRFTLDMHSAQSQISLPAMLGDTSRTLYISFSDGGKPYIIADGCLAKLSIKRPTGTHLEEFCTIESNTTVVYPFDKNENTCAVAGIHNCDVTLYDLEGKKITSAKFTMVVSERAINSDDIDVTDEDQTAIDAMLAAEATRQAAEASRVSAEDERIDAENERVAKENERLSAEESRIAAEAGRVSAEEERQNASEIIITEARETIETLKKHARIGEATLAASAWVGEGYLFSQVVNIAGVTKNSQVDLTPSVEQLAVFYEKDLAFVTENEDGVVTVYAIGQKPQNDYTIQVTITEVNI